MYHGRANFVMRFFFFFGLVLSLPLVLSGIFFSVNYQPRAAAPTSMYQNGKYPVPSGIRLPTRIPPYVKAGDLDKPSGQALNYIPPLNILRQDILPLEAKMPNNELRLNPDVNKIDFHLSVWVKPQKPSKPARSVIVDHAEFSPKLGYGYAGWSLSFDSPGDLAAFHIFNRGERVGSVVGQRSILRIISGNVIKFEDWNNISVDILKGKATLTVINPNGKWIYNDGWKSTYPGDSKMYYIYSESILLMEANRYQQLNGVIDNLIIMNQTGALTKPNLAYWEFNCNLESSTPPYLNYLAFGGINTLQLPWGPSAEWSVQYVDSITGAAHKCL